MRDYLIYTSAGNSANVKQWHEYSKRNYDIWVTSYADTPQLNKEYSDYYNERKGAKFPNLQAVFLEHRDILSNYKAIMVMDDDIIISPKSLSALFTILSKNDLWILQPAFSRFGKISHKVTKRTLFNNLRYVSFIEENVPIFRTDKLIEFLSVFQPEYSIAFGLDWWYMNFFGKDNQNKYAISDKYYCINPYSIFRPGGIREVNKISTSHERALMWGRLQSELGIHMYKRQNYDKIQKSIIELVCSVPFFIVEVLFEKSVLFLSHIIQSFGKRNFNRNWL